MIILKYPANVDGTIKPAGAAVTGLTPDQERRYIAAGTADYPASDPGKPPLDSMVNRELNDMGGSMGLDMALYRTKAEKIAAIRAEMDRLAQEPAPAAEISADDSSQEGVPTAENAVGVPGADLGTEGESAAPFGRPSQVA